MAHHKLDNYLRSVRKHLDLSQRELGFLLGSKSGEPISRYEHGVRLPTLEALLAYELIFSTSAKDLFAGQFDKVERAITARTRQLVAKLQQEPQTPRCERKIAVLRRVVEKDDDYHDEQHEAA